MFDPGSGSQIHDYTPGTWPNQLFWTMQIPNHAFRVHAGARTAELRLGRIGIVDNFQAFGPVAVAAELDVFAQWKVTGPAVSAGLGVNGDDANWTRVEAMRAPARCVARFKGSQTGHSFRTGQLDADDYGAYLGTEKNGSYL